MAPQTLQQPPYMTTALQIYWQMDNPAQCKATYAYTQNISRRITYLKLNLPDNTENEIRLDIHKRLWAGQKNYKMTST